MNRDHLTPDILADEQVATPDEIVEHFPTHCPSCPGMLSSDSSEYFAVRQVFDLPLPQAVFVTEHQTHACRCLGCAALVCADFPDGVTTPAQYGYEIATLAAYLQSQHCTGRRKRPLGTANKAAKDTLPEPISNRSFSVSATGSKPWH